MKRILTITLLCAAAALMGGCFKKVTTQTTAVIKTLLQEQSGGGNVPLTGVDIYAYYNRSAAWSVPTYEDAVARRIVNAEKGEELTEPDAVGTPSTKYGTEAGNYTTLPLRGGVAMIVAVDPKTKMYAVMYKELSAENLPETFLTLIFHPWQTKVYTEGNKTGFKWEVHPPAEPYTPTPEEPENPEGGTTETPEDGTTETPEGGTTETPKGETTE